jgi:hypothetical protein
MFTPCKTHGYLAVITRKKNDTQFLHHVKPMDEIFMKIRDFHNFHLKFPYFYKAQVPLFLQSAHSRVLSSVGWFSNAHLTFDLVLNLIFTMRIDWHLYMWKPNWESNLGSQMNKNWSWEPIQIYIYIWRTEQVLPYNLNLVLKSPCISCWLFLLFFSHGATFLVWWN